MVLKRDGLDNQLCAQSSRETRIRRILGGLPARYKFLL